MTRTAFWLLLSALLLPAAPASAQIPAGRYEHELVDKVTSKDDGTAGSLNFNVRITSSAAGALAGSTVPVNLTQINGGTLNIGQQTMAASVPVTLASNQGNVSVAVAAALPTGSNVVGGVTQSGTWTVQPGNTANTTAWLSRRPSSTRSDTFTATGAGTTVDASAAPLSKFAIQVKGTGAAPTSWTAVLECSLNNAQFTTVLTHSANDGSTVFSQANLFPCLYFRTNVTALSLGSATNIIVTVLGME